MEVYICVYGGEERRHSLISSPKAERRLRGKGDREGKEKGGGGVEQGEGMMMLQAATTCSLSSTRRIWDSGWH